MEGHYIINLNSKCNANCLFCAFTLDRRKEEDPNFENLIKDLKENRKRFDEIIMSGGEPTIYKRLPEYLDQVKACGFKNVTISTNGFMLYYPPFTKKLIEKGVNQFVISFQTIDKNKYHAITGVKDAFKYVTKGMENIKKYGAWIAINTVIHKLNYKKLPDTVNYLIDFNVFNIQLAFMNPIGESVRNGKSTMAVSFTEALPYIKECFKIAEKKGYKKFFVENIPICIIEEYKEKISDLRKPDVNKDYYNACKTKPEKCKACIYFNICDGVWEAYLKQFRDEEIKPILKVNKVKY